MKIVDTETSTDPDTGREKLLVEIDTNDILIIKEGVAIIEEDQRFDDDDPNYMEKFDHVKDTLHTIWTMLYPS